MEIYLYTCETCNTVKSSNRDNGKSWCVMCQVCRSCEFHEKVTAKVHVYYKNEIEFHSGVKESRHDSTGGSEAGKKE